MLTAEGIGGELRVGYRVASVLRKWAMRPEPPPNLNDGYAITAEFASQDPFWSTQAPQALHLRLGVREWRWDQIEIDGNQINVRGTPQEGTFHGKAQ